MDTLSQKARDRLLGLILSEGAQPIKLSLALAFLFDDLTVGEWCIKHSIVHDYEILTDRHGKEHEYVTFSKQKDEEL